MRKIRERKKISKNRKRDGDGRESGGCYGQELEEDEKYG